MATNNSIFEFGDLFGIESPLGNWTPPAEKGFIWDYSTNFPELINYLRTNRQRKTTAAFDYTKFYGYKAVERNAGHGETYTRKDPQTIPYSFQPPDQDESHKRELNLTFIPNKHRADIDFSRKPHFKLYFDEQEEYIRYSVGFWYSNPTGEKDEDIFALYIQALDYPDFIDLLNILDLHITPEGQSSIRKVFESAFSKMAGKINRLDWLYEQAPDYVLCERKRSLLENDLKLLLSGNVNEWGTNEEVAVLNILNGLAGIRSDSKEIAVGAINDTLRVMQSDMTKNKSVFEVLYSKLNDTGGRRNFTRFIQTVYKFWLISDYSNPAAYRYNGEPELIPYQGSKILGYYQDGYAFSFYKGGIAAFKTEDLSLLSVLKELAGRSLSKPVPKSPEPFATYGLFQPLQLPELDQKGEIALPDTIVPAFYLKAFDDKNAWANFEKSVWLGVDIVTTITGFGNLLKLRHLKHLQTTVEYIRIASGTLQVASGIVGTMLNFVNDCTGDGFCARLRKYLFWLDLATFSVDAITERMIRNSAREALENMPENMQRQERGIAEHLKEVSELGKKTGLSGDVTKSFFENAKIALRNERARGKIFGQSEEYTCVATSLKMTLDDLEIIRSESYLADALNTSINGASVLDIPIALRNSYIDHIKTIVRGGKKDINVKFSTLQKALASKNKKAIVSLWSDDFGAHAAIVDKIKDGRVYLRDPLPLYQGSCYSVSILDFEKVFNDKFVTLIK